MGWKLDTTWKGPYTITEVAGKGRYRLRAQSGKVFVLNIEFNLLLINFDNYIVTYFAHCILV